MATLYITSTANTGTGTLRTLISGAAAGDVIQPSPTTFPKGTACSVSLTSTLSITRNITIQGGQTRLVINSTGYIAHGSSSSIPSYINYVDVDFRGLVATSNGAIRCQYCKNHTFLRCSFCGISGYIAPVAISYSSIESVVFQDCAFYGNRATQNTSNAGGAIYFSSSTVAGKCSLINCTMGANYRYYNSAYSNHNQSPTRINHVNSEAQMAEWTTPPPSGYGYSSWTATAYQSMDPRPKSTASWRTGATSTSSTIDLAGNPRKSNGALGAYEYYAGKLATPSNFTASNITSTGFTLSWSAVSNATSYKVIVGSDTYYPISSTTLSFSNGFTANTTYSCQVVACASDYLDSDAATTSVTTTSGTKTKLLSPMLLNHSCGANGLTVTFSDESGEAQAIKIDVLASGTVVATTTVSGGAVTTGTATVQYSGFTYGSTYVVRLTAIADPEGKFADSDPSTTNITWTYQTPQLDPFTSSTLKVQDKNDAGTATSEYLTATTVRIVYYNNNANFSSVKFKYRVANGTWSSEYSTTSPPSGITCGRYTSGNWNGWGWIELTGLTPGTSYEFIAQAISSSSSCLPSVYSDAITFITVASSQLAKPSIHGFPRASGSTIYTTLQIRLAATIENATTYEYQIALDSNFTNGVLTRTSSTVSSGYPVSGYFTGLTSGTTYYCRARAKGDGVQYSDSEWSTVQSTQVASQLATPVVTVSGLSQTTATLSWGAIANRSSYTVKWRVVGASTWNQTTGLTTTSKALTGLTLGTTYEYEVIAVGNGSTYITSEAATGTFTTVALITLDTPTNLASSNITNNSATVSWSGDDRATQFKVEWRASGASTWEEKLVTA